MVEVEIVRRLRFLPDKSGVRRSLPGVGKLLRAAFCSACFLQTPPPPPTFPGCRLLAASANQIFTFQRRGGGAFVSADQPDGGVAPPGWTWNRRQAWTERVSILQVGGVVFTYSLININLTSLADFKRTPGGVALSSLAEL